MAQRKPNLSAWGLAAMLVMVVLAGSTHLAWPDAGYGRAPGPFSDVPPGHSAFNAVSYMAEQGLALGYPDGLYRGERPMTRYEVAAVIYRPFQHLLTRDPAITDWPRMPALGPPVKDVPASHWAASAATSLQELGIIAGYPDATFRGDRPITERECGLLLARLREYAHARRQRGKERTPAHPQPRLEADITTVRGSSRKVMER